MRDCDPVEQEARQLELDRMYLADGRDNPEHEFHALYTGLAELKREGVL